MKNQVKKDVLDVLEGRLEFLELICEFMPETITKSPIAACDGGYTFVAKISKCAKNDHIMSSLIADFNNSKCVIGNKRSEHRWATNYNGFVEISEKSNDYVIEYYAPYAGKLQKELLDKMVAGYCLYTNSKGEPAVHFEH